MSMDTPFRRFARQVLPAGIRNRITAFVRKHRLQRVRSGSVDFGTLGRLRPISNVFGYDRGTPIDRHYIEGFLDQQSADIRGRVLELGDDTYIRRYGGDKVTRTDVLHVVEGNPEATIVADLTDAQQIPSDSFDCIIFTQSLQMIFDMNAALGTLHRILRPGGVLLVTSAGIAKIGRRLGRDDWGEYWHLTTQSMEALLSQHFTGGKVAVASRGNVLTATCFLHGLAAEELEPGQLDFDDPDFEVIVTARAEKAR